MALSPIGQRGRDAGERAREGGDWSGLCPIAAVIVQCRKHLRCAISGHSVGLPAYREVGRRPP
jgi:hypothetical protein